MKKQAIFSIIYLALLGFSHGLMAQLTPLSDTLHINSIRASVQSNGAFFQGGVNGQFLVPTTTGATPEISLIKSAGLWIGGKDAQGALRLSAQVSNENGKTDFYPGILSEEGVPHPEFNLIAGVTRAQVDAHKANPGSTIPAIYGWPGTLNPYFSNYHGFDLPYTDQDLAGYYDTYNNGSYNPAEGDYPSLKIRGCPIKNNADEELWFAFHDVGPHTQSGGAPLNMEIQTQFFGMECPEATPLHRAVYVAYSLINRDTTPLDSCYFGVYIDFEIGNGNDDFIGCNPAHQVVFAYNGDDIDETGFETSPPVMAVDLLRGPLDDQGNELELRHFVPVAETDLQSPEAYYNLLKGRHPDGTPFPNNGLMYNGDPLNLATWSEVSAGNTPGERKALASFGPFTLLPGARNELILGYFWARKDSNSSVADNLSVMLPNDQKVQEQFDLCFDLSYFGCPASVSTYDLKPTFTATVSPNPFDDWVRVESGEIPIASVSIFDSMGRLVLEKAAFEQVVVNIQTGELPSGLYFIQVRDKKGRTETHKLIRE